MKVLCIGDVFGSPGRNAVKQLLPRLVERLQLDMVVANVENVAGGSGLTNETAKEMLAMPVNVLTGGNHTWRFREVGAVLARHSDRVLRPYNFPAGTPGQGMTVYKTTSGVPVGVLNLQGRVFMDALPSPFEAAEAAVARLREQTPVIIVDFHAEATSEKRALGWYLDGKVSAVVGTHTHVQTADEEVLPKGTAYITDLGMTGPYDSVIGMRKGLVLQRFLTMRPVSFEAARHDVRLCAVLLDIDEQSGKARSIERVCERLSRD